MIKVKAHHGEPLNERADTQAENARQLQDNCRQWTVRTPSMTYEWSDSNGVKQTTAWSKTVRKAMVRGGAEYQVQEAMNRAVANWGKTFLCDILCTSDGVCVIVYVQFSSVGAGMVWGGWFFSSFWD